jgi:hypothetical protein
MHGRRHLIADTELITMAAAAIVPCLACILAWGALAASSSQVVAPPAPPAAAADAGARYELVASVRELMDAVVDPSADALWDAVSTTADLNGVHERRPRTDEQWKDVRRHALALIESTNLLVMQGRRATESNPPPPPAGELTPAQVQQMLDNNRSAFIEFARNLRQAARQALSAIDARDPRALLDAGGSIDEACEVCHRVFWYPGRPPAKS